MYVQPCARYAVIIGSLLRSAAFRPTQQASCQNHTADENTYYTSDTITSIISATYLYCLRKTRQKAFIQFIYISYSKLSMLFLFTLICTHKFCDINDLANELTPTLNSAHMTTYSGADVFALLLTA